MTTALDDARTEFEIAIQSNGSLTDAQRRRVEAIVGWNADKFDQIEVGYANKIRNAVKEVLQK